MPNKKRKITHPKIIDTTGWSTPTLCDILIYTIREMTHRLSAKSLRRLATTINDWADQTGGEYEDDVGYDPTEWE